jgi:inner membrane protein YidH
MTVRREEPVSPRAGSGEASPDEEFEPDYRFTLANERTFLAWLRTSLALLAAAVAVVQLVPEFSVTGARHLFGGLLALMSLLAAGAGLRRWTQVNHAIRRGLPLPTLRVPRVLTAGFMLVALLALGLLIAGAVSG